MNYITLLNTLHDILTGMTATGITDVLHVEIQLEDLLELNNNTWPQQTGKTAWLCPVPSSLESNNSITYGVRVYIAGLIKEDFSDRFLILSSCMDTLIAMIQNIPDNINGLVFPVSITPVLLFDAVCEGFYCDISIRTSTTCFRLI